MRVACLLFGISVGFCGVACERPPVGDVSKSVPDDRVGPIDLSRFVLDRPAIGGKWYTYDPSTHVQSPKPQAWILRSRHNDVVSYAAIAIQSIYDTTESGVLTLSVSQWDGDGWQPATSLRTGKNARTDGPACLDVFASTDVDCSTNAWQVRLEYFKRFAPDSLFLASDPGLFLRSVAGTDAYGDVMVARFDDVDFPAGLPDPESVRDLDGPAPADGTTDWAFDRFAPNQPTQGLAIDTTGHDLVLLTSRLEVIRLSLLPNDDGFEVRFASVVLDDENLSIPGTWPAPVISTLTAPATDGIRAYSFADEGVDAVTPSVAWPHALENSRSYDMAIERVGSDVRVLLSPGASIADLTEMQLDHVPLAAE